MKDTLLTPTPTSVKGGMLMPEGIRIVDGNMMDVAGSTIENDL